MPVDDSPVGEMDSGRIAWYSWVLMGGWWRRCGGLMLAFGLVVTGWVVAEPAGAATLVVERLQHVQNLSSEEWDHLHMDRGEPFNSQIIVVELAALIEEFGEDITVGDFVEAEDEGDEDDEDIDEEMDEEDAAIEE